MSTETLTFANFNPAEARQADIYNIGATQEQPQGVIPEMASAFDVTIDPQQPELSLMNLVTAVGPDKALQENIETVRRRLGTDRNAVDIACNWVTRSGLLEPVQRSLMDTGQEWPTKPAALLITDGVRNWMERRKALAIRLSSEQPIGELVLASGNRVMRKSEGSDIVEGMTAADYMTDRMLRPLGDHFRSSRASVRLLTVESGSGDDVMSAAARGLAAALGTQTPIVVVSNAGAWLQNAAQLRRAIARTRADSRPAAKTDKQLFVASDSFELGATGEEPRGTHQNPFSALGQIARNAYQLSLLMKLS